MMQTSKSPALAADLWNTMTTRAKEARAQQQCFGGMSMDEQQAQASLELCPSLARSREMPADLEQALSQPVHPVLALTIQQSRNLSTAAVSRRCCWPCVADSHIRQPRSEPTLSALDALAQPDMVTTGELISRCLIALLIFRYTTYCM